MQVAHGGTTGGHLGRRRTAAAVQSQAFWPTWSSDLARFVKRYGPCDRRHRATVRSHVPLRRKLVGRPWERVPAKVVGRHARSFCPELCNRTLDDEVNGYCRPTRRLYASVSDTKQGAYDEAGRHPQEVDTSLSRLRHCVRTMDASPARPQRRWCTRIRSDDPKTGCRQIRRDDALLESLPIPSAPGAGGTDVNETDVRRSGDGTPTGSPQ